MNPLLRVSWTKRFFILLASFAGVSAIYFVCVRSFGPLPKAVEHVGVVATLGAVITLTTFPPLLLVDGLTRRIPGSYRIWARLVLAVVFVSITWLAAFLLFRAIMA